MNCRTVLEAGQGCFQGVLRVRASLRILIMLRTFKAVAEPRKLRTPHDLIWVMPVVSVTRLRVRSWRFLVPFLFFALRSSRQAKRARGNLGVSLLRDASMTFWTRTLWNTEAAMKSFMLSGAHRQAMPRLLNWCDEAALIHWAQVTDQAPDWHEAHRRIQLEGRRSKVWHPSEAHERYEILRPRGI